MLAVGAVMADSGGIGQGRLGDAGEVFAGAGGLFVMDDRVSARDRQREMRGEYVRLPDAARNEWTEGEGLSGQVFGSTFGWLGRAPVVG